jgi:sulfur-oxidizing protein SoxA
MTSIQGFTLDEAAAQHFGDGPRRSRMEALVAYIAAQSRGMPMAVNAQQPPERRMYELGRQVFFYRAGTHDFACASCHAGTGLRIRLQSLSNLTATEDSRRSYTTWPAYRVSQGELRTMQHRIYDCFRQQRFPAVIYGSDVVTALEMYMATNAQGGIYDAPNIKR